MADRRSLKGPDDSRLPSIDHRDAGDTGRRVLKNMGKHISAESYDGLMRDDMSEASEISDSVPRGAFSSGATAFSSD